MNSKELFNKYIKLNLDGSYIGFEKGDSTSDYFCTPIGAEIIGWDNGIHYCFIKGFGENIFCVNPDSCCDYYVYPIAKNFYDFLGLILTASNANTLQQIILWDKSEYKSFINEPNEIKWAKNENVRAVLNKIKNDLKINPIENPFEYVKGLQRDFPYEHIKFTNEYYDTLGLERPDGTKPEDKFYEFEAIEIEL